MYKQATFSYIVCMVTELVVKSYTCVGCVHAPMHVERERERERERVFIIRHICEFCFKKEWCDVLY